jgi:hypothetical protein
MGRKPKYLTEEERQSAGRERKRRYNCSEKGRLYYQQYREINKDSIAQYFQFRNLMKHWGNIYDALIM